MAASRVAVAAMTGKQRLIRRAIALLALSATVAQAVVAPSLDDPCRDTCTTPLASNSAALTALNAANGTLYLVCDKHCDAGVGDCGFKGLATECRACYMSYSTAMTSSSEWCNALWDSTLAWAFDDTDLDGLTDEEEAKAGTNPSSPDSDGDFLSDYDEVTKTYGGGRKTMPLSGDTDGDGIPDGLEVHGVKLSSKPSDCDGRSATHYVKTDSGCYFVSDPTLRSTDGDGKSDMDLLIAVQHDLGLISDGSSSPVLTPPTDSNPGNEQPNPVTVPGNGTNHDGAHSGASSDSNNPSNDAGSNGPGSNNSTATNTTTDASGSGSSGSNGGLSGGATAGIIMCAVVCVVGVAGLAYHKKRSAAKKGVPPTVANAPVV